MSNLLVKTPEQIQNMSPEEAEQYYNELTSAISYMSDQEKKVWINVQEKRDDKFIERQSSLKAEKKISDLRNERDSVFRAQTQEYDDKTNAKSAALILNSSSGYIKGLQDYVLDNRNENAWKLNSDIMTLKRLSLNSQKVLADTIEVNAYLRYICTMLCFCVILFVLGALKIIPYMYVMYGTFSIFILGLFVIIRHYFNHYNDSKFYIRQKNFVPMTDDYDDGIKEQQKCGGEVPVRHEIIDDYS